MVCRARKTLPCHRNHLSRSRSLPTAVARSAPAGGDGAAGSGGVGGERRPVAVLVMDCQAHGDVEPVQEVLGLGVEK